MVTWTPQSYNSDNSVDLHDLRGVQIDEVEMEKQRPIHTDNQQGGYHAMHPYIDPCIHIYAAWRPSFVPIHTHIQFRAHTPSSPFALLVHKRKPVPSFPFADELLWSLACGQTRSWVSSFSSPTQTKKNYSMNYLDLASSCWDSFFWETLLCFAYAGKYIYIALHCMCAISERQIHEDGQGPGTKER